MPLICRVAILVCMGAGALFCGTSHAADRPVGEDGEWRMPAKDFAGTRFSALADITPQKAPSLHPVWTFSTGVLGGHEGQPLVVGGVMYVVTPWPNVLYAFIQSQSNMVLADVQRMLRGMNVDVENYVPPHGDQGQKRAVRALPV